ncbi:MAG: hypothetical protein WDN06_10950 [Asticcacaulis sp.]
MFNSTPLILQSALGGAGLAYLPEDRIRPMLADGRLVQVPGRLVPAVSRLPPLLPQPPPALPRLRRRHRRPALPGISNAPSQSRSIKHQNFKSQQIFTASA